MALPSINSLIRYINRKLTGSNWNANYQKIVSWLSDGTTDLNINKITANSDVLIAGDLDVTGNVTAPAFIGSGAQLTGLDTYRKNFIINGGCRIKNNADYALVINTYGEAVDRFEGMATGTAVSAGTLTQISNWGGNRTGYAIAFDNCTITGTGIVYLRHRLYSKDAVNFKDTVGSFSMIVEHNVGSSIPYTIYINKADVLNDFTAVTEITNSTALGVSSGVTTPLVFENISFGDCTNGLEILIKIECGAITLKDFVFGDLQLEFGSVSTNFEYISVEEDNSINNFNYKNELTNGVPFVDSLSNSILNGLSKQNITGTGNIAIGKEAGKSITSGLGNILIGENAGKLIDSNSTSIAIGKDALLAASYGGINLGNIAIGKEAGKSITSGVLNILIGDQSGYALTTNGNNVLIGQGAGGLTTGYQNTCLGQGAGSTITTGYNNIAIGNGSQVPTATSSNQVRIGDTNIGYAGVQVAWTITSDISWKENIQTSNLGLDFINELKPVVYNRKNDQSKKTEYGLIAQDLEQTLNDFNIENTGMLLKADDGKLHLRYNDLLPILIKAVQEQDLKIKSLEERLNGNTINQ